jgi:hypothetical protein
MIPNVRWSISGSGLWRTLLYIVYTHMNTSQDDDENVIQIRKGALKSICDAVERAHSATRHAVQLASSARDQFEQEERVLADTVRKLQRLVDGS